ncbi:MAG: hydrogenase maturation protease [Thermomicrobium sp.]
MSGNTLLVVGVGNELCGDDGVGPWIARRIAAADWPGVTAVALHSSDPSSLLDLWRGFSFVYLVDAVFAPYPVGTILRLNLTHRIWTARLQTASTHTIDLWEVIELARTLGELPARLVLYGIVSHSFRLGTGLSPEVEAAARKVVTRLRHAATQIRRTPPHSRVSRKTLSDTGEK